MTVSKLINILKDCDKNLEVVFEVKVDGTKNVFMYKDIDDVLEDSEEGLVIITESN